ncbi:MAG: RNA polymerase sigma factor [Planctomycetota bacterium]
MQESEFTALIQRHRALLHRVAFAYGRGAEDRNDLLQEITLQLWRSRARYDPARPAATWIWRVALNVAISFGRRERRHRQAAALAVDAALLAATPPHVAPGHDLERLHACMERLDPLNRALLLLWLEGHEHAAIGETMGLSATNVSTRLHRIRQQLRRCMESAEETAR